MAAPMVLRQDSDRILGGPVFRQKQLDYGTPGSGPRKSAFSAQVATPDRDGDEMLPPSPDGHYPFLDITRVACVACVCIDHGSSAFGQYNVMFAQEWVLQFLYLVSGIGYGMSKRGLLGYQMRLGLYVVIGVCVNWLAYVVKGLDWKGDFFNVVFHFWFVVGLMIYALLLAPLKTHLQRVREECRERPLDVSTSESDLKMDLLKVLAVVFGGFMGVLLLFKVIIEPFGTPLVSGFVLRISMSFGEGGEFWGWPKDLVESEEFVNRLCDYFMLSLTNIYLIVICPKVFHRASITSWVVIIHTYVMRSVFYRGKEERPWKGLDLMMTTLTCYYLGLLHRRQIGEYVVRYWFIILSACALLWPSGLHERLDENPPFDSVLRFRAELLEAIFLICWLTAGDRMVEREIFTEDSMDFLNDWALLVFLVHKAIHIMFPPPLNWLILAGLVPLCYWRRRK